MVRTDRAPTRLSSRQANQPQAAKERKITTPANPAKAPPKAKAIAKPTAKPAKALKIATKPKTNGLRVVPAKARPAKIPKKVATPALPDAYPPKPAKVSGPKGYTAAEYIKFKELKEKFNDYSNQKLKDLLRGNSQSMTGNKDDLVFKCADGATLGRIPRCPKCFGGRPKFDFHKGTYYCSGYRDDEDFKNCHSTFQLSEITRDAWTDI